MSVDFKAATNFLRSIATAAKVMADALEQVEKDLAGAKGFSAVLPTDPLKDLSGAEQNDLAKNAAEVGSEKKLLDGMDVSQILVDHGCIPYREDRLLDRFLAQRIKNPAKTCIGAERVTEAYQMSILKGIVIIAGEALAIPEYKNDVEIEFISANSEDAKRLPEGAKVMGLLRYAVQFE